MIRIATRERILHAALTVFARKGYHRALVDDIVEVDQAAALSDNVEQVAAFAREYGIKDRRPRPLDGTQHDEQLALAV